MLINSDTYELGTIMWVGMILGPNLHQPGGKGRGSQGGEGEEETEEEGGEEARAELQKIQIKSQNAFEYYAKVNNCKSLKSL